MTKKEKRQMAQYLIMRQIASIGYGTAYEEYAEKAGEDAETILKHEMDRIAKMFGFKEAWTY